MATTTHHLDPKPMCKLNQCLQPVTDVAIGAFKKKNLEQLLSESGNWLD